MAAPLARSASVAACRHAAVHIRDGAGWDVAKYLRSDRLVKVLPDYDTPPADLDHGNAPGPLQLPTPEILIALTDRYAAMYRSRESRGNKAVDSLHSLLIKTLRLSA